MSEKKELDFFSYRYENGFRWYESHFDRAKSQRGDVSPSYFHESGVPERVRDYNPDARIVVSLRDPVERALSQHRHLARLGLVSGDLLPFHVALEQNPTYRLQGQYASHLARWFACFPRERVHVIFMDEIRADAEAVARRLYAFLEIDDSHLSAFLRQKSNPSYVVRSRKLADAIGIARHTTRRVGLGRAWALLARTPLRSGYRAFNRRESSTVVPTPDAENLYALRRYFAEEVRRLQDMTGVDLRAWLPEAQ